MGDSDYSFSLTTFSPSGKLVQIEYALNAVNAGSTSLGIKGAALRSGFPARHGASPLGSVAGWDIIGPRLPRLLRLLAPHHREPALIVWCVPRAAITGHVG
jgi:hypothetical protein